jgi:hypothetical protein
MAERRAISSKIWEDEFFGELSILAQLLWIGLFSKCADDQGRLIDNPTVIRSKVFPYKNIPLEEIETRLVEFDKHIIRYEVAGKKYIQIVKWWENQPMQYAVPSNFPAPPEWVDRYRTCYKGKWIIYNWTKPVDNVDGIALHRLLNNLGRVSSWMDYVATLNPNPIPIPNPIPEEKEQGAPASRRPIHKVSDIPDNLNTPEFLEEWGKWVIFRQEIKHKLTPSTVKSQLKMLEKFGPDVAIKMIEKSIQNGWQGLFEVKNGSSSKSQTRQDRNMAAVNQVLQEIEDGKS